jgi:hypothetical protein
MQSHACCPCAGHTGRSLAQSTKRGGRIDTSCYCCCCWSPPLPKTPPFLADIHVLVTAVHAIWQSTPVPKQRRCLPLVGKCIPMSSIPPPDHLIPPHGLIGKLLLSATRDCRPVVIIVIVIVVVVVHSVVVVLLCHNDQHFVWSLAHGAPPVHVQSPQPKVTGPAHVIMPT